LSEIVNKPYNDLMSIFAKDVYYAIQKMIARNLLCDEGSIQNIQALEKLDNTFQVILCRVSEPFDTSDK
jgi:hypothetical protein